MNQACKECKGSCCKLISFPMSNNAQLDEYFSKRGYKTESGYSLDCICPHLKDGKCSIQDVKPYICEIYEVGSQACRNAVKLKAKHPQRVLRILDENRT